MSDLPQMKLGHVGLYVEDLPKMRDFYMNVLGFQVTDEGEGRHASMVFLSRNREEHHQVVLATGRPASTFSVVNQISFRVETLKDLRAMHDRIEAAEADQVRPTDHGNSWSIYFLDPEGNRLEVYMATPWYVTQPYAAPLDMSKSDDELYAFCDAKAKADPGYMSTEAWREKAFGAA